MVTLQPEQTVLSFISSLHWRSWTWLENISNVFISNFMWARFPCKPTFSYSSRLSPLPRWQSHKHSFLTSLVNNLAYNSQTRSHQTGDLLLSSQSRNLPTSAALIAFPPVTGDQCCFYQHQSLPAWGRSHRPLTLNCSPAVTSFLSQQSLHAPGLCLKT